MVAQRKGITDTTKTAVSAEVIPRGWKDAATEESPAEDAASEMSASTTAWSTDTAGVAMNRYLF